VTLAGIPRVAEVVASIPSEQQSRALDAAESSYRQTLQDLGYEEAPIQGWISAVMFRLRSEVKKQESTKQKMLEALQEELAQAATEADNNVIQIERSEEQ
jgi:Holliday junction resolvasome RuvABC DNA-binding subunit